jgi:glycosyltransferase involved in cell wall biosynthesis
LRVALDAGPLLDPPTGVGRYVAELTRSLEVFGVDTHRYAVALGGRPPDGVHRWRVPARVAHALWRTFGRPSIKRLVGEVDIVHGTNFVLPPLGRAVGVLTVHDLAFFRDDTFPGGRRLRALVPWSLERAARVLVPTDAVAHEVADRFRLSPAHVVVTHEGVSPVFFSAAPLARRVLEGMGIRGRMAIAVGTIEPRKNLTRLLTAWRRAADDLSGWTLVLAGPKGWGAELPETPGVVPIGYVGDETLPGLLAAAEIFCYPSLYEGFGLPPLEAMAAGTPVIAGNYSAAEEVLGDAALLVDPTDVDAIADALVRLARDDELRRSLAFAGRAHAAAFTWERTARVTLDAYKAALEVG